MTQLCVRSRNVMKAQLPLIYELLIHLLMQLAAAISGKHQRYFQPSALGKIIPRFMKIQPEKEKKIEKYILRSLCSTHESFLKKNRLKKILPLSGIET